MYNDIYQLKQEIIAGEDTLIELKEVFFKGNQIRFAGKGKAQNVIAEVFISMANTEGGVIVFGVNDHREIVGVDESKRDILEQFVVNISINNCVPQLEPVLDWLYLPDKNNRPCLCLKVTIAKARYYVHQTSDGRFLKRIGSHRTLIPAEQLGRLLTARRLTIPFEERPVLGASLDDLDLKSFSKYHNNRFGYKPEEGNIPIDKLLGNLKLVVKDDNNKWTPTNLGILLFNDRPDNYIGGAFIDIASYRHYEADGNAADTERIYGTIPEQIEQAMRYLKVSPLAPVKSVKGNLGRKDYHSYSLIALQEAVVNAIVHRDYELIGSQIRIFIFPDRIEFWNPGGLHNTLTPEDLYAGCHPIRRNQHLCGFMRDYSSSLTNHSYMEARGEGFLNLVRKSVKISGKTPELKIVGQALCLTIFAAKFF